MLARLSMYGGYHAQALKQAVAVLWMKPLASLMTMVVIAFTLMLPTFFWVLTSNLQHLAETSQQRGHVFLYLDASLNLADTNALFDRVVATSGVAQAHLKTAAEGLDELQQQEGMQDIMQYLPENPLPAVIEVIPSDELYSAESLEKLQQALKSYPHVEQVMFDIQWVNRLYAVLNFSKKLADGLMMLLACAVILIIGNTLRLAIYNRHEEIKVLQFIGASQAFIMRPFLYLGMCYGLGGALLAMLLVKLFLVRLAAMVNPLAEVYQMHYALSGLSFEQSGVLLVLSVVLGLVGARLSVVLAR